ncbi:Dihydrolipoyllysine-residue acetyltransferase component of pyruvate dehydrogenase complex [Sinobacterium norvegicum]|uniref:Acetyltransferase component of pyruvate dehydrogenase complex n=1 Tax=Sinobacterium norvegicum TaxID=1641715 RepID=A0ABN8EG87_9GAMM|nr:dihydrolipoyllysine-residue acetyltransferase [Sinobacterium norvegicum]CAH0991363.1 Dihydrolipoyllysine-residue acetyltransferase component of pyruvate dehydrogenase complex [Sinobacterium norvegicum]
MSIKSVVVPEGAGEAEVIEICVAVGDTVALEDSLVVLESDKASMEVPSDCAGTITAIKVAEGDTLNEGDIVVEVEVAGTAAEPAAAESPVVEAVTEAVVEQVVEQAVEAPVSAVASEQLVQAPDIGSDSAEVIEFCVAVGDTVEEGDSLIVLESDKASMEMPAPFAGTVVSFAVKEGDSVSEGADVCVIATTVAPTAPAVAAPVAEAKVEAVVEVAVAPVAAISSEVSLVVPDLGTDAAEIIEICIAVGDDIAEGDSLIVLETDKASMEVPATQGGKVLSIAVNEGDKVSEGAAICVVMGESQAPAVAAPAVVTSPAAEARQPTPAPVAAPVATTVAQQVTQAASSKVYAGPAVRMLARELGVDLALVPSTGPKGRIVKEDVHAYVKTTLQSAAKVVAAPAVASGSGIPQVPAVDFAKFGDIETEKLSKIAKITAANMQRSWLNVPHVTQFDDVDITDLEDFRKEMKAEAEKQGVKLTPLPFMLKALAHALKANPKFCSSISVDGEEVIYKKYVHIGMAVDTPAGLVVPVLRDVDKKSIYEISNEVIELATKAKDRKLKPAEMQGACFTISSLGGIGGTGFTPIVNTPEVGILGVSKMTVKPVWNGSEFVPRKMLPVALSYDHRAINGGDAGRFLTYFNQLMSDIRRLML